MARWMRGWLTVVLVLGLVGRTTAAPSFTVAQRDAFLTAAETQLKGSAKVSGDFWTWLAKRPEIKAGLLTAAQPVPPVYAENLDLMRHAVTPARVDRYAHLLLAVSLRAAPIDPKSATDLGPVPAEVKALAAWMKANGVTYLQAMADRKGTLAKAGQPANLEKDGSFWNRLAYESGTYPPRYGSSIPDFVNWVIDHFEQSAPAGAKQAWPLFPLDKAPYPLLAWYQQTVPLRECDWAWERYWGRIDGQPAGIIGYGRYTWDYEKPEVKYKVSDWNPSAIVRMWSDGGVCGRLSTMADCFRRLLGLPAQGVGQPGHRAFIAYSHDAKTGRYGVGVGQSIASLEQTSCGLGLPTVNPFLNGRAVLVYANVAAMNLGLDRYQNSLIAAWLARAEKAPAAQQALYEAAVQLNPYHLAAWKALADLTGSDAAAAGALLGRMDSYLFSPDGALALTDPQLSPDTDFAKLPDAGQPESLVKVANYGTDIARIVGDQLAPEMYQRVLKAGATGASRDLFRAELARRVAKKVPYGAAMSVDLATRFDLAVDGLPAAKEAAAAALATADKVQGKPRAAAVAGLVTRLKIVADAQPPRDAAAWLSTLQAQLEQLGSRLDLNASGAVEVEGLYAELQKLRAASLGRLGKAGAKEVKDLATAYDARQKTFAAEQLAQARAGRDKMAADLAAADKLPAKQRTKALDELLPTVRRASYALPPAEVDAWLTPVLAELATRRPIFQMVRGKATDEATYGVLRGLLRAALTRAGEAGKDRLAAEETAYQAALKAFTTK